MESVIKLATKLGMATTAEGIETAEQWNFLSAVGCTYVQGYYFDRPRSLATVQRKMESGEYALPLGLEPGWAPRPAPTPTAA